jgi:hypothetical protein
MLRTVLALAAFALIAGAQTPTSDPSPIEVTATISRIDPQVWAGFPEGPGLFMTVKNISKRGIQGYAYQTIFTDPISGKRLEVRGHSAYKQPSLGVALAADASSPDPKPYKVPITAFGAQTSSSFTVDLVVFDDGTTWGPAQTTVGKQLLERIQGKSAADKLPQLGPQK